MTKRKEKWSGGALQQSEMGHCELVNTCLISLFCYSFLSSHINIYNFKIISICCEIVINQIVKMLID